MRFFEGLYPEYGLVRAALGRARRPLSLYQGRSDITYRTNPDQGTIMNLTHQVVMLKREKNINTSAGRFEELKDPAILA